MGGVHNACGNSGGIGGGGGGLHEIPSVVGVWIFSGTTQWKLIEKGKKVIITD